MGSSPTLPVPPAGGEAHRRLDLPRLTVLRGLGAVVIVIGHVILMAPLRSESLNNAAHAVLEPMALAGVSGFFTLSGFVLTWTARPGTAAGTFFRRRVARLFPVHVVTLAFTVAFFAAVGVRQSAWHALPSLGLVNVWIPIPDVFWSPNIPSWTLSDEAFFYLLFPALLTALWKVPERRLFPLLLLLGAAIITWAAVVAAVVPSKIPFEDGGDTISRLQYVAIIVFPPARLLDFVIGMVIARVVIAGKVPSGLRPWLYVTLIAGYVVSGWVIPHPFGSVSALTPAVIVGILYSAGADLAGVTTRWATRTLLWLGRISFPLYMVHWSVIYGGYRLLGEPTWSVPVALFAGLGALVISVALAQFLHTFVELPFYRRLRSGPAKRSGSLRGSMPVPAASSTAGAGSAAPAAPTVTAGEGEPSPATSA